MSSALNERPGASLALEIGGRPFGLLDEDLLGRLEKPLPPTFIQMARDFEAASHVLNLPSDANKAVLVAAYGKDVILFNGRRLEFAECIRSAVRCAVTFQDPDASNLAERVKSAFDIIAQDMPDLDEMPCFELTAEQSIYEIEQLRAHLRMQAQNGIDLLVRTFALWLENLAESQVIGFILWPGGDNDRSAFSFHYYRGQAVEHILDRTERCEEDYSEARVPGQKARQVTFELKTSALTLTRERHTHEVVLAREHTLADYPETPPEFVQAFLAAMPDWMRPYCRIADGMVSMQRVRPATLGVGTEIVAKEHVKSVYLYDPAVTMGPHVLVGWSAADHGAKQSFFLKSLPAPVRETGRRFGLRELWALWVTRCGVTAVAVVVLMAVGRYYGWL